MWLIRRRPGKGAQPWIRLQGLNFFPLRPNGPIPATLQYIIMPIAAAKPALLVLADGTPYPGWSFGADGTTVGEVVFNTGMTGYQEVMK